MACTPTGDEITDPSMVQVGDIRYLRRAGGLPPQRSMLGISHAQDPAWSFADEPNTGLRRDPVSGVTYWRQDGVDVYDMALGGGSLDGTGTTGQIATWADADTLTGVTLLPLANGGLNLDASSGAHGLDFVRMNAGDTAFEFRTPSQVLSDIGAQAAGSYQPLDATLTSIAALGTAADKYAYTTGVDTWAEGAITAAGRAILDDADATAQRATLGLVIGTNVQAYDAELAALAGLTSAADKLPYFTGSGTAALADLTSFGRSLIDDANAAAGLATLGAVGGRGNFAAGEIAYATDANTLDSDAGLTYASGLFTLRYALGPIFALTDTGTTGAAATGKIAFYDAAGTRSGTIGYSSGASYAFSIYNQQAGEISLWTTGSRRMTIAAGGGVTLASGNALTLTSGNLTLTSGNLDVTGTGYITGSLMVGSSSAAAKTLEVRHASAAQLRLSRSGSTQCDFEDVAGTLTITPSGSIISMGSGSGSINVAINGGAGGNRLLFLRTAGSNRWGILGTSTAESGSNAGTDFAIIAYNDAGSALFSGLGVFGIVRATGVAYARNGLYIGNNGAAATICEIEQTKTLASSPADDYAACLTLDPGYTGAFTVTRHNYIDAQNPSLAGSAALTDACLVRFDAAAGTHKATVGATTKTTPGGVDAWIKININGTLYYVPAYTSTTA